MEVRQATGPQAVAGTATEAPGDQPLSPKTEATVPQLNQALRQEYEQLFDTAKIRPERLDAVDAIVDQLLDSRSRYRTLATMLRCPWFVPAVIHNMESGLRFDRHLHNGDPLTGRTVNVPKGRPPTGSPPFTWEESAVDALQLKGFDHWSAWGISGVLFKLEQYNGWGYRMFHPEVESPYLWSFSTHYTRGKYVADGRFDPNAVSQQCGAAVLLRRMVDREIIKDWTLPQPFLRYSGGTVIPHGKKLQAFLNTFPGVSLAEDGALGPRTSDAFKKVAGYRLVGDPRGR